MDDLIEACGTVYISPIKTNAWFLRRLLRRPEFAAGRITTSFIGEHLDELTELPVPSRALMAAAATVISQRNVQQGERGLLRLNAFRLNAAPTSEVSFRLNGVLARATLNEQLADEYFDGDHLWWMDGDTNFLAENGAVFAIKLDEPRGTGASHGVHDGEIEAPMPGRVTAVEVSKGDKVAKGQRLLTLEAMKMEHALTAPFDGTVAELSAAPGQQVSEGTVLVKVEPEPSAA
jgi:3-methylcrotonyl-CoA carboxylase alpha subunit